MSATFTFTLLAATLLVCQAGGPTDCAKGEISCHTCLGRDMSNCDWGRVCCKGSCFKVIDEDHNLIAKGCQGARKSDGSSETTTLDSVKLPFAMNQAVTGTAYYCGLSDKKEGDKKSTDKEKEEMEREMDYCNSALVATPSAIVTLFTAVLFLVFGSQHFQ